MKKIVYILVALVVGSYFVNSYLENKATREAERKAKEKILQATKAAVSQMVSRTGAIDDWRSQLNTIGLLTIELERLWVRPRPILFTGAIKDISTADPSRYTVLVENDFATLQLSLLSSKKIIDTFLEKHPDLFEGYGGLFQSYGQNNKVAVVARIHSVRIRTFPYAYYDGDGGSVGVEEVKIGDGELIDIAYTGDVE